MKEFFQLRYPVFANTAPPSLIKINLASATWNGREPTLRRIQTHHWARKHWLHALNSGYGEANGPPSIV